MDNNTHSLLKSLPETLAIVVAVASALANVTPTKHSRRGLNLFFRFVHILALNLRSLRHNHSEAPEPTLRKRVRKINDAKRSSKKLERSADKRRVDGAEQLSRKSRDGDGEAQRRKR